MLVFLTPLYSQHTAQLHRTTMHLQDDLQLWWLHHGADGGAQHSCVNREPRSLIFQAEIKAAGPATMQELNLFLTVKKLTDAEIPSRQDTG